MQRYTGMLLLGLLLLLPSAVIAENFDVVLCKSGTYQLFHKSKEIPLVYSWEENGIFLKAGDSKVFHGMTARCSGIQIGRGENRSGDAFCKLLDQDGDFIIVGRPYQGKGSTWRFLHGTGKYRGIKGSGKSNNVAKGKGLQPGTYQRCNRLRGSYTVPKS